MPANKALPVLLGIILLMVVFVAFKAVNKKAPTPNALQTIPVAPQPDADSPADTVRTLTAHVAELKAQSANLERQNAQLLNQKSDLATSLRATLSEELRRQPPNVSPELNALGVQVASIQNKLDTLAHNSTPTASIGAANASGSGSIVPSVEVLQWIEPLGALPTTASTLSVVSPSASSTDNSVAAATTVLEPPARPAYTVPRNATLIGSTAMTALIGKVPFKDTISDPFPFKVIVGQDNLTANGIDIPGLSGMVFSGHSSGDWTLGCVRGNVSSATFVFDDGTIRTLSGGAQIANANAESTTPVNNMLANGHANNQAQNNAIGWISDKRGIPCISGQRISNAADFLTGRVMAKAAEAAAKAFGQSNTTQSVTPLGGVFSAITGDAAQYAGLNALAGGASEISDYIKERAAQSFDVVYVDTGVELAIHIDRELPIDYDPQGRKTTYATVDATRQALLD